MTCIVCPIGCSLDVKIDGDNVSVTGNKCPRGEAYAQEEVRSPKRVVTATCPITCETDSRAAEPAGADIIANLPAVRRLPVKTSVPCPKEKIPALLKDIYKTKAILPVKAGDVIIENWNELGINIVSTRSLVSSMNKTL